MDARHDELMPSLSSDSRKWRTAFRPGLEDVSSRIDVAQVHDTAACAFPRPYRQTLSAFRAANCTAIRTGLGSHVFAGFDKSHSVPSGFVSEHDFERAPGCVRDRLCHLGLHQTGCAHITNNDSAELPNKLGGQLVQEIFSRIHDLGVAGEKRLLSAYLAEFLLSEGFCSRFS